MTAYDALVIGAGIIGLATAYHIKKERPQDNVLVIDMKNVAGQGDTAKSAAMFRKFFQSRHSFLLASTSIDFYDHLQKDSKVDINMRYSGYLFLLNESKMKEKWNNVLKLMDKRGLMYKIYDSKELAEKLGMNTNATKSDDAKVMNLVDVDYGVFIPEAGSIDVESLVKFYKSEFIRMGGKIAYNAKAQGIIIEPKKPLGIPGEPHFWQEPRVVGAFTEIGKIKARKTIIATGCWINELLDPIGVDSHVKPMESWLFSLKVENENLKKLLFAQGLNTLNCAPFIVLPEPAPVYLKPCLEEFAFWAGMDSLFFGRSFTSEEEPPVDERFYNYGIYPVLTTYFPQFVNVAPYASWSGRQDISTVDGQPIIFEKNNMLVIVGLSGSGIMKADAVGRVAAALYMEQEIAELYGGKKVKTSDFSIEERATEPEDFALI